MNKFKVTIKGNEDGFNIKTKGDDVLIIASMMEYICDCALCSGFSKKDFIERCKHTYDVCKEMESVENE